VAVEDRDYLVPSDAYRTGSELDVDSLVPVIPAQAIATCRARLTMFFVDACRDNPTRSQPSGRVGGQLPFTAGGDFVLVMGCGPGQVCRHTEAGSVFTQSLAQVLDHRNSARSLSQVLDAVTRELLRKSRLTGLEQSPDVRYPAVLESAGQVVICEGDELTAAWRKAADATGLWDLCAEPADGELKEQVQSVVEICAQQCGAAQTMLLARTGMRDSWMDQNYPGRVLRSAELLLAGYPGLRPAEAAMLIAAPFLREYVLADGIRDAAGVDPADLRRTYRAGPRSDLELTHEMYQHVVQRAEGLKQRNLPEPSQQLAMWLVHQWLASRANLWDSAAADDACQLGCRLVEGCTGDVATAEGPMLIQALLLAIGAQPADSRLVSKLRGVYVDDRWRGYAAVLWLAGLMAADLRRVPTVIPDLIGTLLRGRDASDSFRTPTRTGGPSLSAKTTESGWTSTR
jgi:Caspase domain